MIFSQKIKEKYFQNSPSSHNKKNYNCLTTVPNLKQTPQTYYTKINNDNKSNLDGGGCFCSFSSLVYEPTEQTKNNLINIDGSYLQRESSTIFSRTKNQHQSFSENIIQQENNSFTNNYNIFKNYQDKPTTTEATVTDNNNTKTYIQSFMENKKNFSEKKQIRLNSAKFWGEIGTKKKRDGLPDVNLINNYKKNENNEHKETYSCLTFDENSKINEKVYREYYSFNGDDQEEVRRNKEIKELLKKSRNIYGKKE